MQFNFDHEADNRKKSDLLGMMQVMARACGHDHLSKFNEDDLTTWWKLEMAALSGVAFGGINKGA